MPEPARQRSFLSRFRSRRTLSRKQLAAIHAKRSGLMKQLSTYQQGLERIAEVPAEQGAVKFVGKYGRAQRGRAVSQGTVLDKQRRAIGFQIQKAGRELERYDAKIKEHEDRQLRRLALASAGLLAAGGTTLALTSPAGRMVIARGALRFRPLAPVEGVLAQAKYRFERRLVGGAEYAGERAARGAEEVVRRPFDWLMGSSAERRGKSLGAAVKESYLGRRTQVPNTVSVADLETENRFVPGALDRLNLRARRALYPAARKLGIPMQEPPRHAMELGAAHPFTFTGEKVQTGTTALGRERHRTIYERSVEQDLREAMLQPPSGGTTFGKGGLTLRGPKGRIGERGPVIRVPRGSRQAGVRAGGEGVTRIARTRAIQPSAPVYKGPLNVQAYDPAKHGSITQVEKAPARLVSGEQELLRRLESVPENTLSPQWKKKLKELRAQYRKT